MTGQETTLPIVSIAARCSQPDNEPVSTSALQPLADRLRRFLVARPEILEAYLFGSRAHGVTHPQSDVDVAVYVDQDQLPEAPFGYAAELSTAIGETLQFSAVDVVVLNQAPPLLYHRVLRNGLRLMTRNATATTTREGRALSRYCDAVPHLRKVDALHAARIAGGRFGR